ncbi:Retrovirus-related Pol polyprotein from transposon opus [Trichinella spiralis]|uniref:Retrovirus-related Pol polyprotein from transposon opus n=1 Tax=Trichinella spiralis TaxID=6334 RepID=A0ABR3KR11_TRISP
MCTLYQQLTKFWQNGRRKVLPKIRFGYSLHKFELPFGIASAPTIFRRLMEPSNRKHSTRMEATASETINERKRMKDRNLSVGDTVLWRSYGTGPRWMPGKVAQVRDLRDSMLTQGKEIIEESNGIRKKPKYLDDFLLKVEKV